MRTLKLPVVALFVSFVAVFSGCDETDFELVEQPGWESVTDCADFSGLLEDYDINPDVLAALVHGGYYDEAAMLVEDAHLRLSEHEFDELLLYVEDCLLD